MTSVTLLDHAHQEQRPERRPFIKCLRNDMHLFCLILTLLIIGCLTTILWCNVSQIARFLVNVQSLQLNGRRRTNSCDDGYIFIPIAFVIMLYLTYLVECWHSTTRLHLASQIDVKTARRYIQQIREAQPLIWWKAICYHYIRRTRQITRYRNGESFTTTQIYYERINTHIAGSSFAYASIGVKDVSGELADLERHPSTRIRFSKGFAFASMDAAVQFENQRTRFIRESETNDDYLEMREGLDLIGCDFQDYLTATPDKNMVPWYISHVAYWVFSFLLLSWPIRLVIEFKTAHVHYEVTKLFGVNFIDPNFERIESVDSLELCYNSSVAPSYSEAILMSTNRTSDDCGADNEEKLLRQRDEQEMGPSSLVGGQIVFLPRPLQRQFLSSRSYLSHNGNFSPDQPPSYEEAVAECRPLISITTGGLRRSFTENILVQLNTHLRRPWDSISDFLGIVRSNPVVEL